MKPITDKPFLKHYCPVCLSAVCAATGEHWDNCEYEASLGDWVNPRQPLTELEMLRRRLNNNQNERLSLIRAIKRSTLRISDLESKIKQLEKKAKK